jgi:CRISPR-associated protein Cmr5
VSEKPTLDQRRARHAWEAVKSFAAAHPKNEEGGKRVRDEKAKKYGTQARKLPSRIMASGLGQALAFLLAKGDCPELLSSLADWVLDKRKSADSRQPAPAPDQLLVWVVKGSSDDLRLATAEALAYLQWLIRFAEAEGLTDDSRD